MKVNKKLLVVALATAFGANLAYAAGTVPHDTKHSFNGKMEVCMGAALAMHPGEVYKLRAEIEQGKMQYEFKIKGNDGKLWEVECDAKTGKVVEWEQNFASADAPEFKAIAKITTDEAKKLVLAVKPGEVTRTEFSLESDGSASYEFDIKAADGRVWEVEVDAVTGKLGEEPEEEIYQIGSKL